MRPTNPVPDPESQFWCEHFLLRRLSAQDLPWHDGSSLEPYEREAIASSIQQFQLGEGSNGERLLTRGRQYAARVGDTRFVEALSLFIKEEQTHSGYLLRFMRREDIPPIGHHWVDTAFRRLRGLASLELSLRVLVTAEIIAVPYYRALGRATKSRLLRAIGERILEDEAAHLRFQASMLARLGAERAAVLDALAFSLHKVFLGGTTLVVWLGRGKVFAAAGYTYGTLLVEALAEFDGMRTLSALLRTQSKRRAFAAPRARFAPLRPSLSSSRRQPRAKDISYRNRGPE